MESELNSVLDGKTRAQQAHRLTLIGNSLMIVLLLIAARTIAVEDWFNSVLAILALVVVVAALVLNKRDRVELSVALALSAITLLVSISMWSSQGLYSGAILAFPALLVVAGTVASKRLFFALLGSMLCVVLTITVASMVGARHYTPAPIGLGRLTVVSSILIVSAVAISLLMTDLRSTRQLLQQEVERLRASEAKLTHLKQHDSLTDLPNRQVTGELVQAAIGRAKGQGRQLALAFVDIDNFKTINDSLGHAAGDVLLQVVAQRLRSAVRDSDTVSRLGGDEFIMTLPDLDCQDTALSVARRMQEMVAQPISLGGRQLLTSLSIGMALFPRDGDDFATLLRKAELATLRAKTTGRNTCCLFDEQMNVNTHERLSIEQDLRHALANHEFHLYFQPIMALSEGRLVGAEALLRWDHPTRGLLGPDVFIDVAEQSGLITSIGEWVLIHACQQAAAWPGLRVSVNLSAVQFHRGDLEQSVINALRVSGLKPELLELELTESMLLEDSERFMQRLQNLKGLGVQLAIDDFGTGYSNLAYLQRFQVDKLKIDKSFVTDLSDNEHNLAIVTAIIQMARSLRLQTTAEGIETSGAKAALANLGCEFGQGYLFSRPMPANAFNDYMQQRGA
ncbi:putative bifunctional diguanylate cyclase/phosphodiesterase [Halopseudomonas pachastrellae]|uniref:putative bifunctional diguanylate cyclase/phosphodiesterase n=1 Tax=Halopseudomonas pachastrellae TaxID=254161 RepID=UPI003D7D1956